MGLPNQDQSEQALSQLTYAYTRVHCIYYKSTGSTLLSPFPMFLSGNSVLFLWPFGIGIARNDSVPPRFSILVLSLNKPKMNA